MRNIEIKLFGAFRKYVPSGQLVIVATDSISVDDLKQQIHQALIEQAPDFKESTLVFESALATENVVLAEGDSVDLTLNLALLPPVCGG